MKSYIHILVVSLVLYAPGALASDEAGRLLLKAVSKYDLNEVNTYIAQGANLKLMNAEGDTALIAAAASGNLDIVNALIAAGADVNARHGGYRDSNNYTAVMRAASGGHDAIVEALLKAGAKVTDRDQNYIEHNMPMLKPAILERIRAWREDQSLAQ